MADEEPDKETPSLERPRLGFGRKRRGDAADPAPTPVPEDQDAGTTIFEAKDELTAQQPSWAAERMTAPPSPFPPAETPPPLFADEVEPETVADAEPVAADEPEPEVERAPGQPLLNGFVAATLTGAVVGLVIVGLTAASFRLCEVVKGTSSCGNPGFLLLLAIMASTVLLGAAMLRAFRLADPGSTSFLAVGLVAVVTLLFLVDAVFDWWMIIAIPVLAMASFAVSHLVTTRLIEPADR